MSGMHRTIGALFAILALPLATACTDDPAGLAPGVPQAPAQAGLLIEPGNVVLHVGESVQLVVEMRGRDGTPLNGGLDEPVQWQSSTEEIAMVTDDGIIFAQAVGTATITAGCGSYCAYATVTVIEAGTIDPPVGAVRTPGR